MSMRSDLFLASTLLFAACGGDDEGTEDLHECPCDECETALAACEEAEAAGEQTEEEHHACEEDAQALCE